MSEFAALAVPGRMQTRYLAAPRDPRCSGGPTSHGGHEMSEANPEPRKKTAETLADRYLALWNEPDADRRRRTITELWTENGRHFLQPPEEIRGIAAQPGIGLTAVLEARGHEEIEARVTSAYEHWVGSEGFRFRGRDAAEQVGDVVKFHGEALDKNGETFAVGVHVLILAADGRIERDYTFVGA
jgi:hypothetical protein